MDFDNLLQLDHTLNPTFIPTLRLHIVADHDAILQTAQRIVARMHDLIQMQIGRIVQEMPSSVSGQLTDYPDRD